MEAARVRGVAACVGARAGARPRAPLRRSAAAARSGAAGGGDARACEAAARDGIDAMPPGAQGAGAGAGFSRRGALPAAAAAAVALLARTPRARAVVQGYAPPKASSRSAQSSGGTVSMPGLSSGQEGKTATRYSDYVQLDDGLQYQELRVGGGDEIKEGDPVVADWDGYTIGYYGRIIQAKNLSKGGAFESNDFDYLRFTAGAEQVISGIDRAVLAGMRVGGIRRIIVPPGKLSYPETARGNGEQSFDLGVGPVPSTFTGKRALDFVLKDTGLMDKTLLFDIEVLDASRGAPRRGPGEFVGIAAGKGTATNAMRDGRGDRMSNGLYEQK